MVIKKVQKDNYVRVFTDGATVGHNGKLGTVKEVGLGAVVEEVNRTKISIKMKGGSNNEAEFLALIKAMEYCIEENINRAIFYCDSRIIVNRANGSRPKKVKFQNERMDNFQNKVLELAEKFEYCNFEWIPREQNELADSLSKIATSYAN